MYESYLIAAVVAVAWRLHRGPSIIAFTSKFKPRRFMWVWLPSTFLVAMYTMQVLFDRSLAVSSRHIAGHIVTFPIAVIQDGTKTTVGDITSVTIAILQVALLAIISHAISHRRSQKDLIVLGCAMFSTIIIALMAPVMTSADAYAYVGTALSGGSPYHPKPVAFSGQHALVNAMWGLPVIASPYGPLWNGITRTFITPGHSLGEQLLALRVLGAVALVGCTALLAALRTPRAALAPFMLNPVLVAQYVMDAHNDGFGLLLVIAAFVAVRVPPLAAIFVAAAGCIKLPFLALAPLVFSTRRSTLERFVLCALVVAVGVAAYAVFAGPDFLHALRGVSQHYARPSGVELVAHLAAAAMALIALAAALVCRAYCGGASWSFASLSVIPFPWYLGWGVPYAVRSGASRVFLISLPVAAELTSQNFAPGFASVGVGLAILVFSIVAIALSIMQRWRQARSPLAAAVPPMPMPGPGKPAT